VNDENSFFIYWIKIFIFQLLIFVFELVQLLQ